MMQRKSLKLGCVIVGVVLLVVMIGGTIAANMVANAKLDQIMSRVQAMLPAGARLSYGDVSIRPWSLSAALDDVALSVPSNGVDVKIGSVDVGLPILKIARGGVVNVTFDNVALNRKADPIRGGGIAAEAGSLTFRDLDVRALMTWARSARNARSDGNRLPDPAMIRKLDLGPVEVLDAHAYLSDRKFRAALGDLSLSGISAGRLGDLSLRKVEAQQDETRLHLETFTLSGFDIAQAIAWFNRTGGHVIQQDRPDIDFMGISKLQAQTIRLVHDGKTLGLDEVRLTELDSDGNFPMSMTVSLDGISLPTQILSDKILDARQRSFLRNRGVEAFTGSMQWHHAFDVAERGLRLGPMEADFGPLGSFSGYLDLNDIDRNAIVGVADDPYRLVNDVRIKGFSLEMRGGELTAPYLDQILSNKGKTRADLVEEIRMEVGAGTELVFGQAVGRKLLDSLTAFILQPGEFRFSGYSQAGAKTLSEIGVSASINPDKLARDYNIQVDYRPPK